MHMGIRVIIFISLQFNDKKFDWINRVIDCSITVFDNCMGVDVDKGQILYAENIEIKMWHHSVLICACVLSV